MNLPLYSGATVFSQFSDQRDAHRGLLWTRFFDRYKPDFEKPEKGDSGKFIAEIAKKQCGDTSALEHYAQRNRELIEKLGGKTKQFKTQGAFMTGMGCDHPTENGFTWHHTLGVPYLPASSVKGLVRGWLEWNWGKSALEKVKKGGDADKRQQLKNWFGSENKEPSKCEIDSQAGWFIFFDALPTDAVTLAADVMTPHYAKWYEDGGKAEKNPLAADIVPADWHSPVPVAFLTVKKAVFLFGIAVRPSLAAEDKGNAQAVLSEVMAHLQEALEWFGAGAKTAVGYGRMKFDQEKTETLAREQAEQARLAALVNMTDNQREIAELADAIAKLGEKLLGNKENLNGQIHTRAKKLVEGAKAAGNWTDEEKTALKNLLAEKLPLVVTGMKEPKDKKEQLKRLGLNDL